MIIGMMANSRKKEDAPLLTFANDIRAWWDAAIGVTTEASTGKVLSWKDKISEIALSPIGASTPLYETAGLNSLPVINCQTNLSRLEAPLAHSGTNTSTLCAVFRHASAGSPNYGRYFSFANYSTSNVEDQVNTGFQTLIRFNGTANLAVWRQASNRGSVAAPYDTWMVVIMRWGPTLSLYLNKNAAVTSTYQNPFNFNRVGVFSEVSGDEHGRGKVAEFMFIPRALTNDEVVEARTYLGQKYGLFD